MNDEPVMRAIKKVTVEQVVEAREGMLELNGIVIAGVEYTLKISNNDGKLSLDFNDQDYVISIDNEGIKFHRTRYRPNHDHNDFEHLLIGVDDSIMGVKKGEIVWSSRFPYQGEGRDFYRVPFDSIRE